MPEVRTDAARGTALVAAAGVAVVRARDDRGSGGVAVNDGEDDECCEDWDELSSHYHCARCRQRTSMMGHYTEWHKKEKVRGHICCPGDCELLVDE